MVGGDRVWLGGVGDVVSEEGQGMGRWAHYLHFPICLHGAHKGNFTFLTSTDVYKTHRESLLISSLVIRTTTAPTFLKDIGR